MERLYVLLLLLHKLEVVSLRVLPFKGQFLGAAIVIMSRNWRLSLDRGSSLSRGRIYWRIHEEPEFVGCGSDIGIGPIPVPALLLTEEIRIGLWRRKGNRSRREILVLVLL